MDLQNLKGVGEKTIEALYNYNIYNLQELLTYYPYRYQIEIPTILNDNNANETILINAVIIEVGKVGYIKRNLNVLRLKVETNGKIIFVVIYNRAYLKPNLKVGQKIIITGKYDGKRKKSSRRSGFLTHFD